VSARSNHESGAMLDVPAPLDVRTVQRALHNITQDGRLMHSFVKVDGIWTCACGETRDRYGH
jgi:hypothetical protein